MAKTIRQEAVKRVMALQAGFIYRDSAVISPALKAATEDPHTAVTVIMVYTELLGIIIQTLAEEQEGEGAVEERQQMMLLQLIDAYSQGS